MAPIVHGLEIDYWGQVEFNYLDIDSKSVQPFKEQFNFRGQPHLVFLDGDGNVVDQRFGVQSEEALREILDGLVGS